MLTRLTPLRLLQRHGRRSLRGTQYRVRVTNIPSSASWQDLKDFLRDGGDVAHADVDRRGNGVASFATYDDMERAITKLDRAQLMGESVRIREVRALACVSLAAVRQNTD